MGLQVRKRTKGKSGWLNFSYSDKRGLGASASVKVGKNITYNTRGRTTFNFGNGFRWVSYRKSGRKPPSSTSNQPIYYDSEGSSGCLWIAIAVVVVLLITVLWE